MYEVRNSPPKALWRAIFVQITVKKTAKTILAGKNVRGRCMIPRKKTFGGEFRHGLKV